MLIKLFLTQTFEDQIQSLDFHPRSNGSNDLIAIGMTNGSWLVFDAQSQSVVSVQKDGVEQHDVIKYSPGRNVTSSLHIRTSGYDSCLISLDIYC